MLYSTSEASDSAVYLCLSAPLLSVAQGERQLGRHDVDDSSLYSASSVRTLVVRDDGGLNSWSPSATPRSRGAGDAQNAPHRWIHQDHTMVLSLTSTTSSSGGSLAEGVDGDFAGARVPVRRIAMLRKTFRSGVVVGDDDSPRTRQEGLEEEAEVADELVKSLPFMSERAVVEALRDAFSFSSSLDCVVPFVGGGASTTNGGGGSPSSVALPAESTELQIEVFAVPTVELQHQDHQQPQLRVDFGASGKSPAVLGEIDAAAAYISAQQLQPLYVSEPIFASDVIATATRRTTRCTPPDGSVVAPPDQLHLRLFANAAMFSSSGDSGAQSSQSLLRITPLTVTLNATVRQPPTTNTSATATKNSRRRDGQLYPPSSSTPLISVSAIEDDEVVIADGDDDGGSRPSFLGGEEHQQERMLSLLHGTTFVKLRVLKARLLRQRGIANTLLHHPQVGNTTATTHLMQNGGRRVVAPTAAATTDPVWTPMLLSHHPDPDGSSSKKTRDEFLGSFFLNASVVNQRKIGCSSSTTLSSSSSFVAGEPSPDLMMGRDSFLGGGGGNTTSQARYTNSTMFGHIGERSFNDGFGGVGLDTGGGGGGLDRGLMFPSAAEMSFNQYQTGQPGATPGSAAYSLLAAKKAQRCIAAAHAQRIATTPHSLPHYTQQQPPPTGTASSGGASGLLAANTVTSTDLVRWALRSSAVPAGTLQQRQAGAARQSTTVEERYEALLSGDAGGSSEVGDAEGGAVVVHGDRRQVTTMVTGNSSHLQGHPGQSHYSQPATASNVTMTIDDSVLISIPMSSTTPEGTDRKYRLLFKIHSLAAFAAFCSDGSNTTRQSSDNHYTPHASSHSVLSQVSLAMQASAVGHLGSRFKLRSAITAHTFRRCIGESSRIAEDAMVSFFADERIFAARRKMILGQLLNVVDVFSNPSSEPPAGDPSSPSDLLARLRAMHPFRRCHHSSTDDFVKGEQYYGGVSMGNDGGGGLRYRNQDRGARSNFFGVGAGEASPAATILQPSSQQSPSSASSLFAADEEVSLALSLFEVDYLLKAQHYHASAMVVAAASTSGSGLSVSSIAARILAENRQQQATNHQLQHGVLPSSPGSGGSSLGAPASVDVASSRDLRLLMLSFCRVKRLLQAGLLLGQCFGDSVVSWQPQMSATTHVGFSIVVEFILWSVWLLVWTASAATLITGAIMVPFFVACFAVGFILTPSVSHVENGEQRVAASESSARLPPRSLSFWRILVSWAFGRNPRSTSIEVAADTAELSYDTKRTYADLLKNVRSAVTTSTAANVRQAPNTTSCQQRRLERTGNVYHVLRSSTAGGPSVGLDLLSQLSLECGDDVIVEASNFAGGGGVGGGVASLQSSKSMPMMALQSVLASTQQRSTTAIILDGSSSTATAGVSSNSVRKEEELRERRLLKLEKLLLRTGGAKLSDDDVSVSATLDAIVWAVHNLFVRMVNICDRLVGVVRCRDGVIATALLLGFCLTFKAVWLCASWYCSFTTTSDLRGEKCGFGNALVAVGGVLLFASFSPLRVLWCRLLLPLFWASPLLMPTDVRLVAL